jgi:alpha-glucosidase
MSLPTMYRVSLTALLLGTVWSCSLSGQTPPGITHTDSGVELSNAQDTLRIDALRPNVLRVRFYPVGHPAEDASWAVLPRARTAHVAVTSTPTGFSTSSLIVSVAPDLEVTVTDLAGNVLQRDAAPVSRDGTGFRVTKARTLDDHFFGLGDKPGPLDRTGQSFVMWNTDTFGWQESTDPIYKSIPFFLEMHGGRTIGVLFDNTWRTFFDFGHERTDRYTFSAPNGPLDYYVLYGPDPKQVVESYAWLTGPSPLPPLWALGYQQSRYTYFPQARVEEVATRLRADHIPADVIWLDIDFQDKNRPFTVNTQAYPDFAGMVKKLSDEHFKTIAITDLHVADLPNQGYAPYDTGKAGNHFVQENGKDFVGTVWPGPAVFPDFTTKSARRWWGTLFQPFAAAGVAGFWNDMNEPAVFSTPTKTMPDDVVHRIDEPGFEKRSAMHPEIHNVYGMENARATWDGELTLRPNTRPFVMTRASYAGGQRYGATWTGDNSATWNHLRMTTPQLLNLGLSGFALSGADVGGFAGSPSPDLLTRWTMLAAFQPIDRSHAAKGVRDHEPWVDGPEHEAIRRRFIEERYRLMPYLYTTAEEMSRTGLPIIRPLFLEFPHATTDGHPIDLQSQGQFMFGPSVMVAASPSPDEIAPYEVHLPPGVWYDYWTGKKFSNLTSTAIRDLEIRDAIPAASLLVAPKLDELPVYVREGTILPLSPLTQSTAERPNGPLTLRVFPGENCAGSVYQDDGSSLDYQKGAYARESFTCAVAADGSVTVSLAQREGSYTPWWSELRLEIVGLTSTSTKASYGGQTLAVSTTPLGRAVTVRDTGKPQTIRFLISQ